MTRGEYMRMARKNAGLTQDDLARDAGVYKNTPEGDAAFLRFVDAVNGEK
jgi:galactose-1-phosphate uridylyltransferase